MSLVIHFVLFVLFSIFISCGSSSSDKNQEKAANGPVKTAAPVVSDKHILLPASNFYIIPPEGFTINKYSQSLGKENENGYGANFIPMTIITGYTTEKHISGVKAESQNKYPGVWKEELLTVSGVPAKICRYQAVPGVRMYHLFFLDKWNDQSLIANYDETDETSGEAMRNALKTVIVRQ